MDGKKITQINEYFMSKKELDDNIILDLLNFFSVKKIKDKKVIIIDPVCTEVFIKKSDLSYIENLKKYIHSSPSIKIILLPIYNSSHWSLLALIKDNQWYHFDSLYGYHKTYISHIFNQFQYYQIIPMNSICLTTFKGIIVRQKGSWECGYFVIMYALLLLNIDSYLNQCFTESPEEITNDILNSYINQYFTESLEEITNDNINSFINGVIEIINQSINK